ncbi:hypothetical protein [Tsukamurella hominis]|uniref:hypothetical protein n=1 Tax=Tsukamurella hominis TaxID=1970232 RepID=UPI0039EC70DB
MVPKSSVRPNRARVIDIEGGVVPAARDLKAAAEVSRELLDEATVARVHNELADLARDDDQTLTRATRDRDRATPRDAAPTVEEMSSRLRRELPEDPTAFRLGISGRQRKIRSAAKNRVMAKAPIKQTEAIEKLLGDEDPTRWRSIQAQLHGAHGNVQDLEPDDRREVQRLDRAIQSYERENDRDHVVYFAVRMPRTIDPILNKKDLPATMREGERATLDQFTLAAHDPAELPGNDDGRYVIVEMVTNRGLYLGRSDTIADSTHLLPRGMDIEFGKAAQAPVFSGVQVGRRMVVQARERKPIHEGAARSDDPWGDTPQPNLFDEGTN